MLIIDEAVEMQEINPEQVRVGFFLSTAICFNSSTEAPSNVLVQESTVELQPVEMAAYPSGESPSELEEVCLCVWTCTMCLDVVSF